MQATVRVVVFVSLMLAAAVIANILVLSIRCFCYKDNCIPTYYIINFFPNFFLQANGSLRLHKLPGRHIVQRHDHRRGPGPAGGH